MYTVPYYGEARVATQQAINDFFRRFEAQREHCGPQSAHFRFVQ